MKRFSVILLSLIFVLGAATFSGCGCDKKEKTGTTLPANYVPSVSYDSLEEAIKATNIDIKIPEQFTGVAMNYSVSEYSSDSGAIQITYKDKDDRIKLRKGKGTDSVNTYKSVEGTSYEKEIGGINVTINGFNTQSSAEWTTDDSSYAVIISGTDVKYIETVAEQIIEANKAEAE